MARLSLSPASRRYLDSRCAAKRAYNAVRHTYKPEASHEERLAVANKCLDAADAYAAAVDAYTQDLNK